VTQNKIDFANLQEQYRSYKDQIDTRLQKVLSKSNFIMGEEITELESELEQFTSAKRAITCSSGTDALILALMAIDIEPGDEVITTPFSFIATAESIAFLKAKPVFVDIDPSTFNIDPTLIRDAITEKTKAIMPVSLYGQPPDLEEINSIAKEHNLIVIVDGAQSFGARYRDRYEVHYSDMYTTSFFPAKPLGCYGDGGALLTNNAELAEKVSMLRVHGQNKRYHHRFIGIGGRLDTIQAAVLLAKLRYYDNELRLRQQIANTYSKLLSASTLAGCDQRFVPIVKSDRTSVYAQYTLRFKRRDVLQNDLKMQGIPTAVHYPMPLHLQECFSYLGYKLGDFPESEKASREVLSLPMNAFLTQEQVEFVANCVIKLVENNNA